MSVLVPITMMLRITVTGARLSYQLPFASFSSMFSGVSSIIGGTVLPLNLVVFGTSLLSSSANIGDTSAESDNSHENFMVM